jgi:hypothetical protein
MNNNQNGIWDKLPNELYIIGDIHGDFYALKQALELTECVTFTEIKNKFDIIKQFGEEIILIDGCEYYTANSNEKNVNILWNENKKDCSIVFAGDLVDRCRNLINNTCHHVVQDEDCDYKILKLLIDLNEQALKYNSRVIIVLGNHEIMNIEKKLNYLSIKALNNNQRLTNINNLIKNNLDKLYGIIRINNYIICHGGINPNFFDENNYIFNNETEFIKQYNEHLRKFLVDENYKFKHLIINKNSPFWDRTNGLDNSGLSDIECEKIFQNNILNIKNNMNNIKIIVAHCPQVINSPQMGINLASCGKYENRIWRIDIAMSRAFDNYINEVLMDVLLTETEKKIKNNDINLDFILSFNNNRSSELNAVQILKITNSSETIIMGIKSLNYFYNDVFKDDYNYMMLYLFQDIITNYSFLNNKITPERSELIDKNIKKIFELKKIIFNKIYKSRELNYYVTNYYVTNYYVTNYYVTN